MRNRAFLWAAGALVCLTVSVLAQGTAGRDPLTRTTPAWFDEAKLGVFIHWGASSIPAFAPLGSPRGVTPVTSAEAMRAARFRRSTSDPFLSLGKSSWAKSTV